MSYTCVYERTIYHNPANKYSIIRVRSKDESIPAKARAARNGRDNFIRFTAVGNELPLTDKISMVLDGEWQETKYGLQLKVQSCEEIVPQTLEGIRGYLSSRLIKGVGGKIADLIVEKFGADALSILENEPDRLLEIKGISPGKLEQIKESYSDSRSMRDLMILLTPFQISHTTAMKVYDFFGAKAVDVLKNNPFELCKISGFGFKRVDAIVRKGDTPLNSPMRIQGAITAALDTQRSECGHLFLNEDDLLKAAAKLLNDGIPMNQIVSSNEINNTIDDMILHGDIVSSNGNIYHTYCFAIEDAAAKKIAQILAVPPMNIDITSILEYVRKNVGITLSQRQSEAVYMAFQSNLSIITGSPGTGKTTVLKAIIEVFKSLKPDGKIMLAAPTGRASRRMAESTGQTNAKTLHSLLGLTGEEDFDDKRQDSSELEADLIIVDESSMMDMQLAQKFFKKIGLKTRIVLVGDVDQLQSVGAGDVFRELINCGLIPVTVLDEIFRQQKGSRIAHNAKAINEDRTDLFYGDDFTFVNCRKQEDAASIICRIFCDMVKDYGIEKVQILSPFRTEGAASTDHLNLQIREMVNPIKDGEIDLKIGNRLFRLGDKVMQNKNNAKASNGDIGFIRKIETNEENETVITIEFAADRTVAYSMKDMAHIELAYATTIHKAMGSEYDIVIMPVIRSHAMMLSRNLVYTGITRAKQRVFLIGEKGMLIMSIHKNDTGKRNTALGERIGRYLKVYKIKESMQNAG